MKINKITKIVTKTKEQYYDVINAKPYHNFLIVNNEKAIVSHNCNFTDEVNFSLINNPEKQKDRMLKLITQIDARMKSRFMRTKADGTAYLPTLNILASSKDTEQSFLESYILNKQETESKNTLVVDEPQWVINQRLDSPIKFWVALGDKFKRNELLPLNATDEVIEEFRNKGYDMWQVPIGYLDTFQQNLDEAICSIIGKATASSLKYIAGDRLLEIKTKQYLNPFTKDVIEVGNAKDDHLQYANFFDMSRINPDDIGKPMFIHLDMSMTGDKTGIAGVWITGRESNTHKAISTAQGNTAAVLDSSFEENNIATDLHYKLAFSVSIKAPKGAQVSFAKNRNFIRWLRDKGFAIKCVSMDTFQSANIKQDLTTDGFKTEIVSVDRVQKNANGKPMCLPYHYFKSTIYDRRLTIYDKCDLLTTEIIRLERKGDGHVDHPKDESKDQADAVCGATWTASKYSDEYSYFYGDNLNAAIEANGQSNNNRIQEYMQDFEQELLRLKQEEQQRYDEELNRQQEEFMYYKDLDDGIIII